MTPGACSTQLSATCAMVRPSSLASSATVCATAKLRSSAMRMRMSNADGVESVARVSAGGASPGRYLPESNPPPSGLHGSTASPAYPARGSSSRSMSRHTSEYCGWSDT